MRASTFVWAALARASTSPNGQVKAATCDQILHNTCYHQSPKYTGGQTYDSYPAKTVEECCEECQKDEHLCAGFTVFQNKNTKGAQCVLYSIWAPLKLVPGNCSSMQVRSFPALSDPTLPAVKKAPANAKNVLFLVADDMRPSIGPYKEINAHTPNLDRIVSDVGGIAFSRAYIQQSYCAPSRNSFMSGRRPDANKVYSFIGHFREDAGAAWASLPGHFKNNGYTVAGAGKLFHPNVPPTFDQPFSWSPDFPYFEAGNNATNLCGDKCCGSTDSQHWCMYDLKPGTYLSDQITNMKTIEHLRSAASKYKTDGTPFFVGQGYHKPHLTWQFPKRFLDLIPEDVPAAAVRAYPASSPPIAWHECAECSTTGVDKYPNNSIAFFDSDGNGRALPPVQWEKEMRRAYLACIAYVDSLIGDLLNELDTLGITNDTIVTFTGDHGWNLGEHDIWCKMTNSELGTRVPLLFRVPWKTHLRGEVVTPALAELVDWYPTLAELAGVPVPAGSGSGAGADPLYAYLGGKSLVPVMDMADPASVHFNAGKPAVLSQFPRCWQNNTENDGDGPEYGPGDELNHTVSFMSMSDCHWVPRRGLDFMGYSMRTHTHRYIEWVKWDGAKLRPLWDELVARELYDHTTEEDQVTVSYMDNTENENLAFNDPPKYAPLIANLSTQLRALVESYIAPYPEA